MKDIETKPVVSSQIASIGHSGDTLRIIFKSGGVYDYAGFTDENFKKMMAADSLGSFFFKHVKSNPNHPFTKISK